MYRSSPAHSVECLLNTRCPTNRMGMHSRRARYEQRNGDKYHKLYML